MAESAAAAPRDLASLPGDGLLSVLSALGSSHRLRILAALTRGHGRIHVSLLAREVALSRPLVHMHLRKLEAAGLVSGRLELSEDGKAMKFFEVTPFVLHLTPAAVVTAAATLTEDGEPSGSAKES